MKHVINKMIYCYREIYGLNGTMKELEKEFSNAEGVEIYPLQLYDMGIMELNASSKTEMEQLDQKFTNQIISFCEQKNIKEHFFGPLETF